MGCKCTKSAESNNIDLQENQLPKNENEENLTENLTENVNKINSLTYQ